MKPDEPIYLICAPATAPATIRGSTFNHQCSRCSRRVMLAPSGQAWMKKYPESRILCAYCYRDRAPGDAGSVKMLAASSTEIAAEWQEAVPNLWPKRN
jgi:hypothetical protein